MRIYRLASNVWGFGIGKTYDHWHVQFLFWVITTEPGD